MAIGMVSGNAAWNAFLFMIITLTALEFSQGFDIIASIYLTSVWYPLRTVCYIIQSFDISVNRESLPLWNWEK